MVFKFVVLALAIFGTTYARRKDPMRNPDLFHGDIAGVDIDYDRNAIVDKRQKWPENTVYYTIDSSVSHLKGMIKEAMDHISDKTCIKFRKYDGNQANYIKIFYGEGCYSHWGKTGGEQPLSLGEGCEYVGTVIHEILHALGFDHEQNRSDRDDYLIIYWQNIEKGLEDQFHKFLPAQNWLITDFDYNSIMIYGEYAFSVDEHSKTMIAKDRSIKLLDPYDKKVMPYSDIIRIKVLYECQM